MDEQCSRLYSARLCFQYVCVCLCEVSMFVCVFYYVNHFEPIHNYTAITPTWSSSNSVCILHMQRLRMAWKRHCGKFDSIPKLPQFKSDEYINTDLFDIYALMILLTITCTYCNLHARTHHMSKEARVNECFFICFCWFDCYCYQHWIQYISNGMARENENQNNAQRERAVYVKNYDKIYVSPTESI